METDDGIGMQRILQKSAYERLKDDTTVHNETVSSYSGDVSVKQQHFAFHLAPLDWFAGRFAGWQKNVILGAALAGTMLTINLLLMIASLAKFNKSVGYGTLYRGSYSSVNKLNTGLHLLINVLSTILLGACNFTMQCLNAPTRTEVDRAHTKGRMLEIGIPSLSNLPHISRKRSTLWLLLALSTLPLHVFWNSVIFPTITSNAWRYLIVDESFFSDVPPALPPHPSGITADDFTEMHQLYQSKRYENLTVSDCIGLFQTQYISQKRHLLAVTKPINGTTVLSPSAAWRSTIDAHGTTNHSSTVKPLWNGSSIIAYNVIENNIRVEVTDWICSGYDDVFPNPNHSCDKNAALQNYATTGTWWLRPADDAFPEMPAKYPIEYCMSYVEEMNDCTLSYVPSYISVVVICNVVKVICMIMAVRIARHQCEPVFATVGDSVASFLEEPDKCTSGMCLMGYREKRLFTKQQQLLAEPAPRVFEGAKTRRLFFGTPLARWILSISICLFYLLSASVLLGGSVVRARRSYPTAQSIFQFGLGVPVRNMFLSTLDGRNLRLSYGIVVANCFQVALTVTYFFYNSLLTSQCGALEWSTYAKHFKPLRVSHPIGSQTSSHFLQMPLRYAAGVTIMFAVLHWFVSESVFMTRLSWSDGEGAPDPSQFFSRVGYSPIAILCAICLGAMMVLLLLLHSLRSLDTTIPPHGNLSAAISAACHAKESERAIGAGDIYSMATKPLKWGAVSEPEFAYGGDVGIGHCTFSASHADAPRHGGEYA